MTDGRDATGAIVGSTSAGDAAQLGQVGHSALKRRHYPAAIDAFSRALALAPDHEPTRLALGVSLQGAKRHREALESFERIKAGAPEKGAAHLHAAFSLLALGRALAAREAATQAIALLPRAASAHYVFGQAEATLGRAHAAERALMIALEIDPSSADMWASLGAARSLAGDAAGSEAALRKALELNPAHAAARAALARSSEPRGRDLELWNPGELRAALGLAVDYLSKKPVFARLPFGEWSRTLAHQVGRGQQLFVVDGGKRVLGYLGWAVTDAALAEQWLQGLSPLSDEQCRGGDCVILNAWAADSKEAAQLLVSAAREIFHDKSAIYFKRFYGDRRARPMRLSVNKFVASHLARSTTPL